MLLLVSAPPPLRSATHYTRDTSRQATRIPLLTPEGPALQAFLFTDIEASTRLWEEHPEQMPAALARHDSILRDAVERSGGRVLKTTGDGMIAVFDSLVDGLGAATQAQKSLGSGAGRLRDRCGYGWGSTQVTPTTVMVTTSGR